MTVVIVALLSILIWCVVIVCILLLVIVLLFWLVSVLVLRIGIVVSIAGLLMGRLRHC